MGYNRRTAKSLLTASEYELFVSSLPDSVSGMSKADLRKGITRARRARDKYSDLHRRQSETVRGRAGARAAALNANERTSQKADVFSEVLGRFEHQLAKTERAEQREARQASLAQARLKAAPPSSRAQRRAKQAEPALGATGFVTDRAKAARAKGSTLRGPTAKNISAARSAAGRRSQAKRDSR